MMQPQAGWQDVPIEDGWQGFLNVIRKVYGKPLRTERAYVIQFGPVEIPPGESVTLTIPLAIERDEQ